MKKRKSLNTTSKPAPPPMRERQAIVVLGMHRSGTSALTGVLAKLGARPPRSPMAGNEFNPRGYWESHPITIVNDQILQSAGSRWNDWVRFNPDWRDSVEAQQLSRRAGDALESEYGDSPLIVLKDPRVSRFLPVWQVVLDQLGIALKTIVSLRHPAEVSQSLARRDGFGPATGHLLWLRHLLDAELSSRALPRSFIRYDDLLKDWKREMVRVGKEIGTSWPRLSAATTADVSDFLTSELRHHRVNRDSDGAMGELGRWTQEVYEILAAFARGEPQCVDAFRALDRIREEFDRTSELYGPVAAEAELAVEKRHSRAKSELSEGLVQEKRAVAEARTALEDAERRAVRAENDARSRAGRLLTLQAEIDKLQGTIAGHSERYLQREVELQARIAVQQSEIDARLRGNAGLEEKNQGLEEASRNLVAINQDLQSRVSTLEVGAQAASRQLELIAEERARFELQLKDATERNQEIVESLNVQHQERERALAGNKRLSASLAERFRELAAFASAMEAQRIERDALEVALARLRDERQDAVARLDSLQREHALARTALADTTAALDRLRATARSESARRKELESRTALLEASKGELESRVTELSGELRRQREFIDSVLRSNSWKLGRPLRVARRILGGKYRASPPPNPDVEKIRVAGVFDEAWYLARYPDVAVRGMDPILHYLSHGCSEGRDPSADFSTKDYYESNPEAAANDENALLHALSRGAVR